MRIASILAFCLSCATACSVLNTEKEPGDVSGPATGGTAGVGGSSGAGGASNAGGTGRCEPVCMRFGSDENQFCSERCKAPRDPEFRVSPDIVSECGVHVVGGVLATYGCFLGGATAEDHDRSPTACGLPDEEPPYPIRCRSSADCAATYACRGAR